MAQLSPGRAILAGLCMGVGAAVGSFALLHPGQLSFGLGPAATYATPAAGVLLVLLGLFFFGAAFRPSNAPAPIVPAHVAFTSRQVVDPSALQAPAPRPVSAQPRAASASAVPAPPLGNTAIKAAPMDPEEQIRDITRKISRAGVMLATGKLSNEGYVRYVEDLKKQRSVIEANLAHREFYGSKP